MASAAMALVGVSSLPVDIAEVELVEESEVELEVEGFTMQKKGSHKSIGKESYTVGKGSLYKQTQGHYTVGGKGSPCTQQFYPVLAVNCRNKLFPVLSALWLT